MTESEWQRCADPWKMLTCLGGKASDRKLRLFACACCRVARPLLTCHRLREGIETAERYSDGQATYQDMVSVAKAAEREGWSLSAEERPLADAVWAATAMGLWHWLRPMARTARTVRYLLDYDGQMASSLAGLLRDVFGPLPFRTVAIESAWRTTAIMTLAEDAYEKPALPAGHLNPACLSELADALFDAGCQDADLLVHLRSSGPHCRGCWAVDAVLGRG